MRGPDLIPTMALSSVGLLVRFYGFPFARLEGCHARFRLSSFLRSIPLAPYRACAFHPEHCVHPQRHASRRFYTT